MTKGAVSSLVLLIGLLALAPSVQAQAPAQRSAGASAGAARSVMDGVYTPAQAKRGNEIRTNSCAMCHGGSDWNGIIRGWNGRSVADLVEHLRSTMPMGAPGSLKRQEYADVVAYMLSINGIPAGKTELKDDASLKSILITAAQK